MNFEKIRVAEERIASVLLQYPEIAKRTTNLFASEPTTESLKAAMSTKDQDKDKPTQIRLDADILQRADDLIDFVKQKPELRAAGRISRSSVLRIALLRGLDSLEIEARIMGVD